MDHQQMTFSLPETLALPETMTDESIAKLEEAFTLIFGALRRRAARTHRDDAGAAEYDSWAPGAAEYDSWTR